MRRRVLGIFNPRCPYSIFSQVAWSAILRFADALLGDLDGRAEQSFFRDRTHGPLLRGNAFKSMGRDLGCQRASKHLVKTGAAASARHSPAVWALKHDRFTLKRRALAKQLAYCGCEAGSKALSRSTHARSQCAATSGALEFERQIDLRAIRFDLSLRVQLHIEFDDFCDANIAERFGGLFDRVGGGLFPGFFAGADQLNNIVDALRHVVL